MASKLPNRAAISSRSPGDGGRMASRSVTRVGILGMVQDYEARALGLQVLAFIQAIGLWLKIQPLPRLLVPQLFYIRHLDFDGFGFSRLDRDLLHDSGLARAK